LQGKVKGLLEEVLETIAESRGIRSWKRRLCNYIHLFIEADPFDSPMNIVNFKGVSSLRLRNFQS